ncbi:MAG: cyclic nucleotide-binding domain-containing protein [Verrucomicrobiales bacterium]|nr:cyclic nucleotide-binding domain-containing protein [Verrucomicrobiales bacterium]
MQITTSTLAAQPFFRGLSGQQLGLLLNNSMSVEFPAGKSIFREGELANRFYLVIEGEVALESASKEKDGIPRLIQTIGAGDVLGWSWLIPPHFWRFDARAVKPTKAIFIYGTRVRELCENDHDLGYELMKRTAEVVIGRLQSTRHQLLGQS